MICLVFWVSGIFSLKEWYWFSFESIVDFGEPFKKVIDVVYNDKPSLVTAMFIVGPFKYLYMGCYAMRNSWILPHAFELFGDNSIARCTTHCKTAGKDLKESYTFYLWRACGKAASVLNIKDKSFVFWFFIVILTASEQQKLCLEPKSQHICKYRSINYSYVVLVLWYTHL